MIMDDAVLDAWRSLRGLIIVPRTSSGRSSTLKAELDVECAGEGHESHHPHDQCVLMQSLRERAAEEPDRPIVLITASLVMLSEAAYAEVYLVGADLRPVALTTRFNPAWLRGFLLGDLYANENLELP